MKKIINLTTMLFTLLIVTNFSFAQDKAETEKITKYLESTIEYRHWLIVSHTWPQKVLALDIIESELTFNPGKEKTTIIIQEQYFIKSDNKLIPYKTLNDMLSSNEFIGSIKTKKFKLNTEEDGVAFQSMLWLIDKEPGLGFFKENNSWYFIRSKFFDDIEAYVVTTDKKGQIASVVYQKKLRKEVPKTLLPSAATLLAISLQSIGTKQDMDVEKVTISKKDSTYMHNYLLDDLNYVFEISPNSFNSVNEISTLSIFKCALKITDEFAIGKDPFLLVVSNNEYITKSSVERVLKMPLFLKSLQEKYKIETEEDARLFLNVLEDLVLIKNNFYNDIKTFYKKENMWIFVRKKRFNDLEGYILKVDKRYRVSYIEYTTISDENIERIKNKDPDFKMD